MNLSQIHLDDHEMNGENAGSGRRSLALHATFFSRAGNVNYFVALQARYTISPCIMSRNE